MSQLVSLGSLSNKESLCINNSITIISPLHQSIVETGVDLARASQYRNKLTILTQTTILYNTP